MLTPVLEDWGLIAYEEAWTRQREIQKQVIAGTHPGCVVMCEHPPTVTAGSSTQPTSFALSPEELAKIGIGFYKIERGGDLTLHRPGQLVCYPLLDLNQLRRDVHWYMRALESAVIATCSRFGVPCERIPGRTGVWIVQSEDDIVAAREDMSAPEGRRRKIASIGVRLSRWCSMHGLALNVSKSMTNPALESLRIKLDAVIVPCGLSDIVVTSLEEERRALDIVDQVTVKQVAETLAEAIKRELGFNYMESR